MHDLGNLKDESPYSGGEYFYTSAYPLTTGIRKPALDISCFVCGTKTVTRGDEVRNHLKAIAQCEDSTKRIISMFKNRSCNVDYHESFGTVSIFVSACERHKRHLEFLHSLVAYDGIITADKVKLAEKAPLSSEEFYKLVSEKAHNIWSTCEKSRKASNWCDAWPLCLKEHGHIPSPTEHKNCAERLWRERKDAEAMEDWLEAEREVAKMYSVE